MIPPNLREKLGEKISVDLPLLYFSFFQIKKTQNNDLYPIFPLLFLSVTKLDSKIERKSPNVRVEISPWDGDVEGSFRYSIRKASRMEGLIG